ncbi:hypothetical protein V6N13_109537 [Hibiscus sabdariffa]|uniref:Uncharacterized protein n=1 Tax=Hibiscus sabdariffa TaxID=183260 RepID=A0ABR2FPV0_9ROSI
MSLERPGSPLLEEELRSIKKDRATDNSVGACEGLLMGEEMNFDMVMDVVAVGGAHRDLVNGGGGVVLQGNDIVSKCLRESDTYGNPNNRPSFRDMLIGEEGVL